MTHKSSSLEIMRRKCMVFPLYRERTKIAISELIEELNLTPIDIEKISAGKLIDLFKQLCMIKLERELNK